MVDDYIGFNISSEEKEDWKQYVDENPGEFSSLTQLIIKSVQAEMRDDHSELRPPEEPKEVQADVDLDPIQDRLDQMNERISALTGEVRELELATDSDGEDAEMMELMVAIHDTIPQVEDASEFVDTQPELALPPGERAAITGRVEDITDALKAEDWEVTEAEVSRAAARLAKDRNNVRSMLAEGERHYYEVTQ